MPDATRPDRVSRPFVPRLLRYVGLAVLAATVGSWAVLGAHRGWSQNRVPVNQVDEITGIAYVTYEERFVPGIDWLGAGSALAGVVFALSFLPRLNPNPSNHTR
ncbi:MAG: hypothetical protein KF897_00720 [Opitutaceae bacterium]|nr:hypothetical protein [Opitutaceae bacterium]